METVAQDTCILYLWQNRHTVVIGRNQNAWKECKVSALEQDNGYLARRLSGGGAVFHDLGNLNFTFLVPQAHYDVAKQTEVIMKAVSSFGLKVERSGRNDITVDGRKFSGNAYYKSGKNAYHHGTLLVDVDMQNLSTYLNVSADKLATKGVDSVKSRVVNLKALSPDITISLLSRRLITAFESTYGLTSTEIEYNSLDRAQLQTLTDRFASWQWRLGRKIPFDIAYERRFPWGDFALQLSVNEGLVQDAAVFSDAMDSHLMGQVPTALIGLPYQSAAFVKGLETISTQEALSPQSAREMIMDIGAYIKELNF